MMGTPDAVEKGGYNMQTNPDIRTGWEGDNYQPEAPQYQWIPVDKFGWQTMPGSSMMQNIYTGNVVPVGTVTDSSTVGTPYETDRGGGFGGFLGVGDWIGKNITMPAGKALGENMQYIVPALAAAITAGTAGAAMGAGAAGAGIGTGAAGAAGAGGATLAEAAAAGLTIQEMAAAGFTAAEIASVSGAGVTAANVTAALASGTAGAGAGAGIGVGSSIGMGELTAAEMAALQAGAGAGAIAPPVAAGAGAAAPVAGGTATVAPGTLGADLVAKGAGAWTVADKIAAASLGITAATTIAAIAGGGDKPTSATTTTTPTGPGTLPMPGGGSVTAGVKTFEDYINDFYGLAGDKSVKTRTAEDQTALQGYQKALLDKLGGLDTTRLAETKAALLPYQNQLTDIQGQLSGNTGLGKQVAFGYGGKQMASFVPKTNRALADQLLGMGRESSSINTGLVDMGYKSGTDLAGRQFGFESENLPNKAADTYSAKLEALMKYLNPNTGQTSTTTGTVPGVPWYTTALQGLNTGVNLWDKIYNPRSGQTTLSAADIAAIRAASGGG
uniref:Uncharacterized protein n=1 Tax=viral metagenome TaxID=1070528 RepID=A0A6M3K7W6_9ZZZZ